MTGYRAADWQRENHRDNLHLADHRRVSARSSPSPPYPPGIPAVLPGERITAPVLDYLRSGVAAGMVVPDAADGSVDSVRVLIEN